MPDRRASRCVDVLVRSLVAARAALVAGRPTHAQTPAQSPPDLLIKSGRVIDPRNNIDAVMDVAVVGRQDRPGGRHIAPAPAMRVIDATGLYVVPGLIDIHAHVFFGTEKDAYLSNADSAVQPDSHSFRSGQTTLVDAGGAGGGTSRSSRSR